MALTDPNIRKTRVAKHAALPLPDQVALVLQGGGALGSYQAGVFESLSETGIEIDWVAGISIGAANAALIAGNPPEKRVEALRNFWKGLSSALPSFPVWHNDQLREFLHEWSASFVATMGVPGFFQPRAVPPMFAAPGTCEALSFYDSSALKGTLDALIEASWVRPAGRREMPGRPLTYATTRDFLAHFGLTSRRDLPGIDDLRAAGLLDPLDLVLDQMEVAKAEDEA